MNKTVAAFGIDRLIYVYSYFPEAAPLVKSEICGFIRHPAYASWIYLGCGFFLIRGSLASLVCFLFNFLAIVFLSLKEEEEIIRLLDRMKEEKPLIDREDEEWSSLKSKFQNSVIDFEQYGYNKSLSAFLDYSALLTGMDVSEESEDKVTMMTVHSAKGTEFPVVIMIGMEQGNFPIISPEQTESDLEEERRLCYVGMTRAKKQLYMTSVRFRESDRELTPSQFIWEIQPGLIKTIYPDQIRKTLSRKKRNRSIASN